MLNLLLLKNYNIYIDYIECINELSLINFYFLDLFLNKKLKYYEKKIFFFKNKFLRCKADIENFKKRSNEEISKTYKYAIEDFVEDLLFIADSLESAINDKSNNLEKLIEGSRLTLNLLKNSFNKNSVTQILPSIGDKFNPYEHLAISTLKVNNLDNSILNILQKGYLIFNKTIRPALVVVNKV